MEQAFACSELLVARHNAGAAVHARYVPLALPGRHAHEASLVAAFAVRAGRDPVRVHLDPEGDRADPAEEHLHESGRADLPTEGMAHYDGCDDHVDGDADDARFHAKSELSAHDLVPDGLGRHEISGQGDPARQGDDNCA